MQKRESFPFAEKKSYFFVEHLEFFSWIRHLVEMPTLQILNFTTRNFDENFFLTKVKIVYNSLLASQIS